MIAEPVHKVSLGVQEPENGARFLRRISLEEYHLLVKQNFFKPDERLELIEGILVAMSPVHPPHAYATARITEELTYVLGRQVSIRCQLPITLPNESSEPEPDFIVAKRLETYINHHPNAGDIFLVGEVSDSTLVYDRTTNLSLYARARIQEYWILNLQDNQLEVYRDPEISADGAEGTYRTKFTIEPEKSITPLAFPQEKISLKEVFPQ